RGRRPGASSPVPLLDAGPRRAGGSGERQTERPTSDVNFHRRMPETPDEARYGAPAAGDSPSFARAAPNSAWKRSGTAGRLAVHHAWIARTASTFFALVPWPARNWSAERRSAS